MIRPEPRKGVAEMKAYVPGERPRNAGVVKLNTNECPYPPPPAVIHAIQSCTARSVRLYPDPECTELRTAIGETLRLSPDQIMCTNGSDEVLRLIAMAYMEPGDQVCGLSPTYSLYPILCQMMDAKWVPMAWRGLGQEAALLGAPDDAKIIFVANPNPPIGLPVDIEVLEELANMFPRTLIVIDEAYTAFSNGRTALRVAKLGKPNVLITRSFSKSHSLAGMRLGFVIGHKDTLDVLRRVRDSYPVNAITQAAGLAAWKASDWLLQTTEKIVQTRDRVRLDLQIRGFDVPPSEGNFLFVSGGQTEEIFKRLKERDFLVRWFDHPEVSDGLRVTVGTDEQMDMLLGAFDHMMDLMPRRQDSSGIVRKLNMARIAIEEAYGTRSSSPASGELSLEEELDRALAAGFIETRTPVPSSSTKIPRTASAPPPISDLDDDLDLGEHHAEEPPPPPPPTAPATLSDMATAVPVESAPSAIRHPSRDNVAKPDAMADEDLDLDLDHH